MAEQANSKVPKIRFKGFVGEWEEKTLGEIYSERNERGNNSLQILSVSIHSGVSNGELDDQTLGKQVRRSEDKSLYKHVYTGDVVLNMMRAWQGGIGVATVEGMVSPAYITAIPGNSIYPIFMNANLRRSQIVAQMDSLSYGVTYFRKRLYWDSFIRVELHIPSVPEQNKIAVHFSHLDSLISLQQRKQDKLVTLKKAMLHAMFPQPGTTTPEIRFKGFEGAWVEKTLGELMPITSAARVHKNEWTRSGVPFFRTSDVVSRFKGEENERAFISRELYEELSGKIGRIKRGDILITGGGSIGIPFLANSDEPLYFKDADLLWLKVPESVDSTFLYVFLTSESFRKYLKNISHIGTIAHYTVEQAKSTPITMPPLTEQQKIGTYFRTLDELISKHALQIVKLKQLKTACLERMFV